MLTEHISSMYTSHVLCKHSNGERASLADFKIEYRHFVSLAKALLIGCLNLGESYIVDSLVLVDRLL